MPRKSPKVFAPPGCRDQSALLRHLVTDARAVQLDPRSTTALSYPEFLRYFRDAQPITRHHLIIGAHFAYGWMPTILDFRSDRLDVGVELLEQARSNADLDAAAFEVLARLMNNSTVGASKLLHFAAPDRFAIWDSRVATYLGTSVIHGAAGVPQYSAYNECCRTIATLPAAKGIAKIVSQQLGMSVSSMRALELVMFDSALRGVAPWTSVPNATPDF